LFGYARGQDEGPPKMISSRAGYFCAQFAFFAVAAVAAGCGPGYNGPPVTHPQVAASATPAPAPTPTPTPTPIPAPLSLSVTTMSFSAASQVQTDTITDGNPGPYTASGCTGIVTASVSGTTVTVTSVAAGTCTLTVSDTAGTHAGVAITVSTLSIPVQ